MKNHKIRIGRKKHSITLKESWQDWTVREWLSYMDAIKEGDNVDVNTLISLACNGELSPKQIDQANAQDIAKVLSSLEYVSKGFNINAKPTDKLWMHEIIVNVPKNLDSLTFGQANAVGNMLVKAAKDETPEYKLIPDLVAIWLDWTRYSDPKYKDESIENVLNSKCLEVVPVGFFFLKNGLRKISAKSKPLKEYLSEKRSVNSKWTAFGLSRAALISVIVTSPLFWLIILAGAIFLGIRKLRGLIGRLFS